jgi:DNA-directed RNA polymerase subunit RPC12/RpoP
MDIIFRGTIPEEKQYLATCGNCGTKVVYKLKEVEEVYDPRDGSYHGYNCPLCGKRVYAPPQLYVDPIKNIHYSSTAYDYYNK